MPHWESAASQPREIVHLTDRDLAEVAEWAVRQALRKERVEPRPPRFATVFRAVLYAYVSAFLITVALMAIGGVLTTAGLASVLAVAMGAR